MTHSGAVVGKHNLGTGAAKRAPSPAPRVPPSPPQHPRERPPSPALASAARAPPLRSASPATQSFTAYHYIPSAVAATPSVAVQPLASSAGAARLPLGAEEWSVGTLCRAYMDGYWDECEIAAVRFRDIRAGDRTLQYTVHRTPITLSSTPYTCYADSLSRLPAAALVGPPSTFGVGVAAGVADTLATRFPSDVSSAAASAAATATPPARRASGSSSAHSSSGGRADAAPAPMDHREDSPPAVHGALVRPGSGSRAAPGGTGLSTLRYGIGVAVDALGADGRWQVGVVSELDTVHNLYGIVMEGDASTRRPFGAAASAAAPVARPVWLAAHDVTAAGTYTSRLALMPSIHSSTPSTAIFSAQLQKMLAWIRDSPTKETGGDLFGRWLPDGQPFVVYVLGPGPKAMGGPVSFYQDPEFLEANAFELAAKHKIEHIGEWHSHHRLNLASPSYGDSNTVVNAMQNYGRPNFLLCIGTVSHHGVPDVQPYIYTRTYGSRYQRSPWEETKGPGMCDHFVEQQASRMTTTAGQWYLKAEGQTLLKQVVASTTRAQLGNAKMIRNADTHCLEIQYDRCVISFPSNFPAQYATLRANGSAQSVTILASGASDFGGAAAYALLTAPGAAGAAPSAAHSIRFHGHA